MQRYFIKNDDGTFDKDDSHHIINVMRLKDLSQVIVCHEGICHLCEIKIEGKNVGYHKLEQLPNKETLKITLIQGLPKGSKVDAICKTSAIFGADRLIFVPMIRSIAKLANEEGKLNRFEKIIKEASELAHRNTVMDVSFKNKLNEINWQSFDYILLADEEANDQYIQQVIKDVNGTMALIIGPEGGIDSKERTYFKSLGAHLISLGALIIPTELAHIGALQTIYDMKREKGFDKH